MVSLFQSLKDALIALKANPKLFLPKIILAIAWGFLLLWFIQVSVSFLNLNPFEAPAGITSQTSLIMGSLAVMVFAYIAIFLIDIFVNSAYPFMIDNFYQKKPVKLIEALKHVSRNAFHFMAPTILAFIIALIIALPFLVWFLLNALTKNFVWLVISAIVSIVVIFLLSVFFYFIFPVAVLEKKGFASITSALKVSKKHFGAASVGVIITYVLSILTALIAAFGNVFGTISLIGLIAFIIIRVLTAIFATYQMVLNPVLYLEHEKRIALSETK